MHYASGQGALHNRYLHSTNTWNVCHVPLTGSWAGDSVVKKASSVLDVATAHNATIWNTCTGSSILRDFRDYFLHGEDKMYRACFSSFDR